MGMQPAGHISVVEFRNNFKRQWKELIATKSFFVDFTYTGPLEHHIKNVSLKYTIWKLLKIVVLKAPGFLPAWKRGLVLEQTFNV